MMTMNKQQYTQLLNNFIVAMLLYVILHHIQGHRVNSVLFSFKKMLIELKNYSNP